MYKSRLLYPFKSIDGVEVPMFFGMKSPWVTTRIQLDIFLNHVYFEKAQRLEVACVANVF